MIAVIRCYGLGGFASATPSARIRRGVTYPSSQSVACQSGGPRDTNSGMDTETAQALIRFGLGRRPAEPVPADPHAWLGRQLQDPDPAQFSGLSSAADGLVALREDRAERRADPAARPGRVRALFLADAAAQIAFAIDTPAPFRERLVWFWSNHFTVSRRQGAARATAGVFVREAIRPHVTGRFADMLLAVMRHPAMLMYLDNVGSVGPNSPAGQRRHRGLNENLARECLELHTVGTAAGYTQADVTAFANILTGWSVDLRDDPPGFRFHPRAHEPGAKTLMGREFPPGEAGGMAALGFLADHPATHRHLATKLAAYFVADDPPPQAVRRIAGVLDETGGDLGAAALAVTRLPHAWQPLVKLRTPQDFVLACVRALDLPPQRRPDLIAALAGLGQPLWAPPLPNGWPDRAAEWATPEALLRRLDWAYAIAGHAADAEAAEIGEAALGPLLRPATLHAVQHAGSRREALTLLLSSPEFLRR